MHSLSTYAHHQELFSLWIWISRRYNTDPDTDESDIQFHSSYYEGRIKFSNAKWASGHEFVLTSCGLAHYLDMQVSGANYI